MRRSATVAALLVLAGCEPTTPIIDDAPSQLNVVNAATDLGVLRLLVNGQFRSFIEPGSFFSLSLPAGSQSLEVRDSTGATAFTMNFYQLDGNTIVVRDSSGFMRPAVLADTGAIVPAGKSKLRVAHYAQSAPAIDIWRTQPDFQEPTRVMFPFNFGDESSYIQSDPGVWRVMVSSPVANPGDPMPDTLAISGPINVPAATSRTVVVVDGPLGLQFVVLTP